MKTIRVIACGDGTVPYVDEAGRFHANRAMGRGVDGAPAAELVSDTHYVRRAMRRGHLVEAPEPLAVTVDVASELPVDPETHETVRRAVLDRFYALDPATPTPPEET